MEFEWDSNKSAINLAKHGISFEDAKEAFYDEFALLEYDESHSAEEERFVLMGRIKNEIVIVVSHCIRGGNAIRIISTRKATSKEKEKYIARRFWK